MNPEWYPNGWTHCDPLVQMASPYSTPAPSPTPSIDRALLGELVEALERCQKTLANFVAPDAIKATDVRTAWAQAVEAESKARATLAKARVALK